MIFLSKNNKLEAYVYFNNDDKIEVGQKMEFGRMAASLWLNFKISCKGIHATAAQCGDIDLLSEYEKIYHRISKNL